ncbi:MAG TPA: tetratricopeptide repeat protein, partial [Verrucomicrobiae bacterium]|nr:tetratricopeptide repeat protein [Verrucomicrobiae bacterium]
KDVLSAFFWLQAIWAYRKYANGFKVPGSRFKVYYGLTLLFFALGLMSKPMVVTLPFVLLLLDYWPLKRSAELEKEAGSPRSLSWKKLALEKVPFFVLAATASVVTYMVQKGGGAMRAAPLVSARLENALVSYSRYLGKLFWPTNLAVFYPHPAQWPMAAVVSSALLLVGITAVVFLLRRQAPYLLVGWLWFAGTLVPVIGLVQVGEQSMADRYTYLPSIGLFLALTWGFCDLIKPQRGRVVVLSVCGAISIILCAVLTAQQISYWKNSRTLFEHALAATDQNATAALHAGSYALEEKRLDEAIGRFQEALKAKPDFADAHGQLGAALYLKGSRDDAITELQTATLLDPGYAPAHFNLGVALAGKGRLDDAIGQFQAALKYRPEYAEAHNGLGVALWSKRRGDEAVAQFEQAIALKPGYAAAHCNLGVALAGQGRRAEAMAQFTEALRLRPDYPQAEQQLRALSNSPQP